MRFIIILYRNIYKYIFRSLLALNAVPVTNLQSIPGTSTEKKNLVPKQKSLTRLDRVRITDVRGSGSGNRKKVSAILKKTRTKVAIARDCSLLLAVAIHQKTFKCKKIKS